MDSAEKEAKVTTKAIGAGNGWMKNTVHGLPMQSRGAAAYRAVPAERAMILAHMMMDGGKCN